MPTLVLIALGVGVVLVTATLFLVAALGRRARLSNHKPHIVRQHRVVVYTMMAMMPLLVGAVEWALYYYRVPVVHDSWYYVHLTFDWTMVAMFAVMLFVTGKRYPAVHRCMGYTGCVCYAGALATSFIIYPW